jgi:hypothetical protein
MGGRDIWYVEATADMLAAGRKELRKALAEIVKTARGKGWVDEKKAKGWLEKLRRGRVLMEGWPRYKVRLVEGALVVRFSSTDRNSIQREAQRLRAMGLEEGIHFSVKMPEEGREGYVSILREGLKRAAWLSKYGSGRQRELAARCGVHTPEGEGEGEDVYEKAKKIIEEGKARGSLRLKGFEKEVEVNGEKYKVKVIDGEAVKEKHNGKTLLRIRITAEVDGVRSEYTITYGRYGRKNNGKWIRLRQRQRAGRQGGRREETRRRGRGTNGQEAEDTPHEERYHNHRVRQEAPRRL